MWRAGELTFGGLVLTRAGVVAWTSAFFSPELAIAFSRSLKQSSSASGPLMAALGTFMEASGAAFYHYDASG